MTALIQIAAGAGIAAIVVPPWIWAAGWIARRWPA